MNEVHNFYKDSGNWVCVDVHGEDITTSQDGKHVVDMLERLDELFIAIQDGAYGRNLDASVILDIVFNYEDCLNDYLIDTNQTISSVNAFFIHAVYSYRDMLLLDMFTMNRSH